MGLFRAIYSLFFFGVAVYFLVDGLIPEVDWLLLVLAALCFIIAYHIWPSKRRGKREDEYYWADLIEIIIELPIMIFLRIFRLLVRLFKDGNTGADL